MNVIKISMIILIIIIIIVIVIIIIIIVEMMVNPAVHAQGRDLVGICLGSPLRYKLIYP